MARPIALLSNCLTLQASDVLGMGARADGGCIRNPPEWLQAGATIEVEMGGIGVLSHPVLTRAR